MLSPKFFGIMILGFEVVLLQFLPILVFQRKRYFAHFIHMKRVHRTLYTWHGYRCACPGFAHTHTVGKLQATDMENYVFGNWCEPTYSIQTQFWYGNSFRPLFAIQCIKFVQTHFIDSIASSIQLMIFVSFVSDYVYFETSSTAPFQIRRIEELNKTPSGNVEAKVMCFYRRRDLPNPLVQLADKHQSK